MADIYVDLDKSASTEDGTSWANAYRLLSEIAGASLSDGDTVWIKGSTNQHSGSNLTFAQGTDSSNPVKYFGVKSATTAEPPVQSDLIPGWFTGEARTLANRAYKDADRPILAITSGNNFIFSGRYFLYGLEIRCASSITFPHFHVFSKAHECLFELTGASGVLNINDGAYGVFVNCGFETNAAGHLIQDDGFAEFIGLELIATVVPSVLINPNIGHPKLIGCDLSGMTSNSLVKVTGIQGRAILQNCRIGAAALVSGTIDEEGLVEVHQCSTVTGKSSGTILDNDKLTLRGSVVEETTVVRTGGANDGSSGYSLAFTPAATKTLEQYAGLAGPWMAFKVTGDGTSKTVSVPIANSGAADYNDDDVWLEIMYPSEGGTAQYDNITTQMDLLGTPAAVTDDTDSTWGTGGNNPQTLSASIAPDYVGRAYCRVVFAKNFSSSPETLYADPLPVVS